VGGNRVSVGPTRSTVAPLPSTSLSSTPPARTRPPVDQGSSASDTRSRAFAAPGVVDRSDNSSRQAVPRADARSRGAVPYQPSYGTSQADRAPADDAITRANPYIRRAPDSSARPGLEQGPRPGYQPYAIPRSGGFEVPSYGTPRAPVDAGRPGVPDNRSQGMDRRAPGVDRPAGPPPGVAAPPPGVYRANPGVERGPGPAPENHGGGQSGQGHSRGGQPSTGSAVPRGR
jgi:hypothetical protein